MTRLGVGLALLLLAGAANALSAVAWSGKVTHVTDGDTLWVQPASGGKPVKVRIAGIDAPEICQSGGRASRAVLTGRLAGRQIDVRTERKDDYGRIIAALSLDGDDIGGWMVSGGQAWSYRFGRDGGPYVPQQLRARAAKRGLFADPSAQEPRLFRKHHGPCAEGFIS